ncbi:helix-turn-helix domain-containing protein [Actinoalloteichus caeruleus]|uniref:helix-turn-helix domain-containing protein n=1 Tax=Actinoalloteichus cyanogriseus TaxID=2893586 RepID=UPI00068F866B|nr:helix-turn-helix transcriptional regulator [Actinoalloteichus caeruleus]
MSTAQGGLGPRLRQLRERSGISARRLAELVGMSPSTVCRIETAKRLPTETEVASILAALGVAGETRAELVAEARRARYPNWWETAHPALPAGVSALLELEGRATRIVDVSVLVVPALLRTPEYARTLVGLDGLDREAVEARVAVLVGRQAILSGESVTLTAFVDEQVLRRPVGGPAAMARQLRHLARMATRPNVVVRVIPVDVGAHPALRGPSLVLEFARGGPVVHLEHCLSDAFLTDPAQVRPHVEALPALDAVALSPDASRELVLGHADEMEQQHCERGLDWLAHLTPRAPDG